MILSPSEKDFLFSPLSPSSSTIPDHGDGFDPLAETLHQARSRLWREGRERYEDFNRQMDEAGYRTASSKDVAMLIFRQVLERFPPLPAGSPGEPTLCPIEHLDSLPDTGDVRRDIDWAYQNLEQYIRCKDAKDVRRLKKIEKTAPSRGAVGMLEAASNNPQKFRLEVVPNRLIDKNAKPENDPDAERQGKRVLKLTEKILGGAVCPKCGEPLG